MPYAPPPVRVPGPARVQTSGLTTRATGKGKGKTHHVNYMVRPYPSPHAHDVLDNIAASFMRQAWRNRSSGRAEFARLANWASDLYNLAH